MSTCNRLDLQALGISTDDYAQKSPRPRISTNSMCVFDMGSQLIASLVYNVLTLIQVIYCSLKKGGF
jgi:hypothetical protein